MEREREREREREKKIIHTSKRHNIISKHQKITLILNVTRFLLKNSETFEKVTKIIQTETLGTSLEEKKEKKNYRTRKIH